MQKRTTGMDDKQIGPLDEIAGTIRSLSYGEMIDLAAELWKAAGGAEITAETLPAIFHQWSKGCAHRPETPHPLALRWCAWNPPPLEGLVGEPS